MRVTTQSYPWRSFAARAGRPFDTFDDTTLADIARAGYDGWEPIVVRPEQLDGIDRRLRSHGLVMPTAYVNSVLHDPARLGASVGTVLSIAERLADLGTTILVTNPAPLGSGPTDNKTDDQLRFQAEALDSLGGRLAALGVTLALHNHDAELRAGAREFHHMLSATDPGHVSFCLDAHWVYRGCLNSMVGVDDAVRMYGHRIVELHLRQSHRGIFDAVFGFDGDVDYASLFAALVRDGHPPPALVMEQSIEPATEVTDDVVECHRQSLVNLRRRLSAAPPKPE